MPIWDDWPADLPAGRDHVVTLLDRDHVRTVHAKRDEWWRGEFTGLAIETQGGSIILAQTDDGWERVGHKRVHGDDAVLKDHGALRTMAAPEDVRPDGDPVPDTHGLAGGILPERFVKALAWVIARRAHVDPAVLVMTEVTIEEREGYVRVTTEFDHPQRGFALTMDLDDLPDGDETWDHLVTTAIDNAMDSMGGGGGSGPGFYPDAPPTDFTTALELQLPDYEPGED